MVEVLRVSVMHYIYHNVAGEPLESCLQRLLLPAILIGLCGQSNGPLITITFLSVGILN